VAPARWRIPAFPSFTIAASGGISYGATLSPERVPAKGRNTGEPAAHSLHWSTRNMARHSGISTSSVGRIWRAFGLQPHRVETFKLSTDPLFVDKVRDIVGLYRQAGRRAIPHSKR
jgi:hypothetical protein